MQLRPNSATEILGELSNARDDAQRLQVLRAIKNNLTGHELRKIEYIQAGLLPCLSEQLSRRPVREDVEADGSDDHEQSKIWSCAASIVAVVANSGTAFTLPILKSDLIELLFARLRASTLSRLILTILRCLNSIADNLPLANTKEWAPDEKLATLLYNEENVTCLVSILTIRTNNFFARQVSEATLNIICKTCTTEKQKLLLVRARLLESLCLDLGSSLVSNKAAAAREASKDEVSHISTVLQTISLLIENSKSHSEMFLKHDALVQALVRLTGLNDPLTETEGSNAHMSFTPSRNLDITLPIVPDVYSMNAARRSNFPPLGLSASPAKRRASMYHAQGQSSVIIGSEDERQPRDSLITLWLLHVVRTNRGRRRIAAARLLAILKSHGLITPTRVRSFSALLVPILVGMLDAQKDLHGDALTPTTSSAFEFVPATLALVVRDNEILQEAAVHAKAIPKLAAALKAHFEVEQEVCADLWWPQRLDRKLTEGEPRCSLGPGGPTQHLRSNMRTREGLLKALAALANDNEEYRKQEISHGVLAHITAALEPFHSNTTVEEHGVKISVLGNSPQTLIAACSAIRALTRSPTSLRTKLVDADVAKSVIGLLHESEPEVRIAVTMVIANLAHDFSPMKQTVGDPATIRKLCEQAHSANARLRFESLFALKALVNNSTNQLKKQVIDDLGPSWIRHLIATDPCDVPEGEVIGLVERDYRKGSMVRWPSEAHDTAMDLDEDEAAHFGRHSVEQDLDIQAELLAFLRNLTAGENPCYIIDYLLEGMQQQDDFMQIIVDRLKGSHGQRRKSTVPYSPIATIVHSVYIVTHLAAADRKYRASICNHTVLLKQILNLLNHSDAGVRSACCWLITNLIYQTSAEQADETTARARELQQVGIMKQIRRLESDAVMDVKERAVTASECFTRLLGRA